MAESMDGDSAGAMNAEGTEIDGPLDPGRPTFPARRSRSRITRPSLQRPQEPSPTLSICRGHGARRQRQGGTQPRRNPHHAERQGPVPRTVLMTGRAPRIATKRCSGTARSWSWPMHLTRHGVAVLRLDDRGVGASSGTLRRRHHRGFRDRHQAACGFLQVTRRGIDPSRVGLIGTVRPAARSHWWRRAPRGWRSSS